MGRTLSTVPGCALFLEGEMTWLDLQLYTDSENNELRKQREVTSVRATLHHIPIPNL